MIAYGHSVVSHLVHGDINGPAGHQIGDAGSLVQVSAVQEQQPVFFPGADVLHLVGDISQAVMQAEVVRVNDIAMHIGSFHEREDVFPRRRRLSGG